MDHATLHELLQALCYGTHLHAGVLMFGRYGNEKLMLPHEETIHASPVCEYLKNTERGYAKCFKCRNSAIRKAIEEKTPFAGLCVNGIYEYTHPVMDGDELICIIFIGNILDGDRGERKLKKRLGNSERLTETMERCFDERKCNAIARVIESYIRALLQLYPPNLSYDSSNRMIENVKRYVTLNPENDVSISEVARIFHYNEKYLGRLFKQRTGMTFHEYINRERLERAERLLIETDESVLSISERVGFNNVTYFNRLFKQLHKKSPIAFRRDVRQYPEYLNSK